MSGKCETFNAVINVKGSQEINTNQEHPVNTILAGGGGGKTRKMFASDFKALFQRWKVIMNQTLCKAVDQSSRTFSLHQLLF